jgi:integrase/recombinase XerD
VQRRKKPRVAATPRERDPAEASGFYPYLVRFLDWSAVRGYTVPTNTARAVNLRRFILWCAERNLDRPQDVTRPIL